VTPTKSRGLSSPVAQRVPAILLDVEGFQYSVCGSGAHQLGYKAVVSMFPFRACRKAAGRLGVGDGVACMPQRLSARIRRIFVPWYSPWLCSCSMVRLHRGCHIA
jgi:hypothetical protein